MNKAILRNKGRCDNKTCNEMARYKVHIGGTLVYCCEKHVGGAWKLLETVNPIFAKRKEQPRD